MATSSNESSNNVIRQESKLYRNLKAAIIPALIFVAVSLPWTYNQTDKLIDTYDDGCPSPEGKFLHTLVFFAVTYFIMKVNKRKDHSKYSDGLIAKYAFYGALIFFLLSSNDSYKLTGKLVSGLSTSAGCPTLTGVIVHGLVFLVVLVLVMYFPRD